MSSPRPGSPIVPSLPRPLPPGEEHPQFILNLPADLSEDERRRLEAYAKEYERRCWVETGAPPKWDLLLRADPAFAEAVRKEADRIYRQAMLEIAAGRAREDELQRRMSEELRRDARSPAAAARSPADAGRPVVPHAHAAAPADAGPALPRDLLTHVLARASRFLAQQGDDATLRRLAQSFRLANTIATTFRWPVIWNRDVVRATLRPRVANLRYAAGGNARASIEVTLAALDNLIDIICDPGISPEDTRTALDTFLRDFTRGFPPPKDLMTKALEFTSAKSLWLRRYRLFYPGADSTAQLQKIPDFLSPFGPGDNVQASGFNQMVAGGPQPVLNPLETDPAMAKRMEAAYASVFNDIKTKVRKYSGQGRVVITVDATNAPWMHARRLQELIEAAGELARGIDAVYLLKGGTVERVWPP